MSNIKKIDGIRVNLDLVQDIQIREFSIFNPLLVDYSKICRNLTKYEERDKRMQDNDNSQYVNVYKICFS